MFASYHQARDEKAIDAVMDVLRNGGEYADARSLLSGDDDYIWMFQDGDTSVVRGIIQEGQRRFGIETEETRSLGEKITLSQARAVMHRIEDSSIVQSIVSEIGSSEYAPAREQIVIAVARVKSMVLNRQLPTMLTQSEKIVLRNCIENSTYVERSFSPVNPHQRGAALRAMRSVAKKLNRLDVGITEHTAH